MIALALAALVAVPQPPARFSQITFVSGAQVYVGAGRDEGVAEGMELAVLRGDTIAATLRVQYVSSHQAACVVLGGAGDLVPGDRVRYVPAAPDTPAPAPAAAPATPPTRKASTSTSGLHGRLSSRYGLSQVDGTGSLSQPAFDARIAGAGLGGTPLGVIADVRARASRSSVTGGSAVRDQLTDVYQLAVLWQQPGAPFRLAVGRQYLSAVSSIVLLDGALAELNRRLVSVGVFAGLEPVVGDSTAAPTPRDAGGYVQLHTHSWSFTLGAAGSYAAQQANREFGFAQLNITGTRGWLYATQQVDYYRGAKVAAGERALSFTSAYLSAGLRAGRALTFDAGLDNRRNVRLYRDLQDPLATFDDSYRRAAWGGVGYARSHWRVRLEARGSGGGGAGVASAVTASAGMDRLRRGLGIWARVTRYQAGQLNGWLGALRAGADVTPVLHLEATGGARRESDPPVALGIRNTMWYGADANVSIGRAWYALVSINHESGPDGAVNQVYGSLSWRF